METYRRHLPHWRIDDTIYFVTWRLRAGLPPLEFEERSIVARAIEHFDGERYRLIAYVVMDDHVHVLMGLSEGTQLRLIVHSWKSFTANQLQRKFDREQAVWQNEYHDHIIRNTIELNRATQYIAYNPVKRWSDIGDYPWLRLFKSGQ